MIFRASTSSQPLELTAVEAPSMARLQATAAAARRGDADWKVGREHLAIVHIEKSERDQSVKLTQKGLIKRIIEALNIEQLPRKDTPALRAPLTKDLDGDPADGSHNYASAMGMLQCLQNHSRPDITCAVSLCARFTHNPKRSHEMALEHIGQCLKGTVEEGLIMKPTDNFNIDVHVDADFAGLWPHEDKNDPTCVKSRTGCAICIADCPVLWGSKLQGSIALSTTEAECNALSMVMRLVLPLLELHKTIGSSFGIQSEVIANFRTTVWEDNNGCLILANLEPGRQTPRSKHCAIKQHWFRAHLKPNGIEVKKIDTHLQKADILTKSLGAIKFREIRKLLCGW